MILDVIKKSELLYLTIRKLKLRKSYDLKELIRYSFFFLSEWLEVLK